jgi:hypothetical protein
MHNKNLSKQSLWAVEVLSVILPKINGGHKCWTLLVPHVMEEVGVASSPNNSRLFHPGRWKTEACG